MSEEQSPLIQLHDLVDVNSGDAVYKEVAWILTSVDPHFDLDFQATLFRDIEDLFRGDYPGYRRSNTGYHDLVHTRSVYLATARLMHGYVLAEFELDAHSMNIGLASALFHDVGLIQTDSERKGTGARFTVGHEVRSARFASQYLLEHGLTEKDTRDCDCIIECTRLDMDFQAIPFSSPTVKKLGMLVGTSDLLAQMADRLYLEKLLLLYQEFQEARIGRFDSELAMLHNTKAFYSNLVVKRFAEEFQGVDRFEEDHFRERLGKGVMLYKNAIEANLVYLDQILEQGADGYRAMLRRGGIVRSLKKEDS